MGGVGPYIFEVWGRTGGQQSAEETIMSILTPRKPDHRPKDEGSKGSNEQGPKDKERSKLKRTILACLLIIGIAPPGPEGKRLVNKKRLLLSLVVGIVVLTALVYGGVSLAQTIGGSSSAKTPPSLVANPQSVSTNEDTAKTITLTGSISGRNPAFEVVSGSGPTNGTLGSVGTTRCTGQQPKTCSADVTYTPNEDFNGSDSFKFRVNGSS